MKQFQIFRYIKKWRYLIVACMVLGGMLFYYYASNKQTYTASVRIRYTNSGAEEGRLPDGSTLDVSDIFSSRVINGVLTDLDISSSVEGIRSRCDVDEIIPDDEEILKAALLDQGKEYEYYPTDYVLRYTAGSSSSATAARRVLSAVLDNYFRCYAEDYISEAVLPNNASNVTDSDYDYIEKLNLIEQSISSTLSFLTARSETYSGYRSSQTGYSFADLEAIYQFLYDNKLPYLYAQVIDLAVTKDADVQLRKFEENINEYARRYENGEEKLSYIDRVVEEYAQKLHESVDAQSGSAYDGDTRKNVLQSVYDWDSGKADRTITYDELINQRIAYQMELIDLEVQRSRAQDYLDMFSTAADSTNDALDAEIERLISELSRIHDTLRVTYNEFNNYRVSQNISVISNINVSLGLNVKLYLALTVVVFFVFGCAGAILLGRGQDIMEYVIYNDQKTGLPNRARCDMEIAKYDSVALPDNFCCVLVCMDNLRTMNDTRGYAVGNTMLRQLALILKEVTNGLGFVGYNNSGQYLCLFNDCSEERAQSMKAHLAQMVERYNRDKADMQMKVNSACVCTTQARIYDIKQLVQKAYQSLREQA